MVDNNEYLKNCLQVQAYIESEYLAQTPVRTPVSTIANCVVPPAVPYCMEAKCKKEKGINPMDDKVYHLKNRIDEIAYDFKDALITQFGVKEPRTFTDLVAAITGGKYVAPDSSKKIYSPLEGVKWGDQTGYEAALKSLKAAKQTAIDIVMVKDPATDGFAAMQAFEAWTYTAPTTA